MTLWWIPAVNTSGQFYVCGALRDLVLSVQFEKRKKHPWKSVIFINGGVLLLVKLQGLQLY